MFNKKIKLYKQLYENSQNEILKLRIAINKLIRTNEEFNKELKLVSNTLKDHDIIGVELDKYGENIYVSFQKRNDDLSFYLFSQRNTRKNESFCFARLINIGEHKKNCFIDDINVINKRQGEGSILLKYLIFFAKNNKVTKITGNLSPVDKSQFKVLENFYIKNGFDVVFNDNRTSGKIQLLL